MQGRELPIPELVPFRLTPDLIDGLGISGVEGVFRRGAEETLRVLRDQSETIMTVLAVFRYDPLQKWSVPFRISLSFPPSLSPRLTPSLPLRFTGSRMPTSSLGSKPKPSRPLPPRTATFIFIPRGRRRRMSWQTAPLLLCGRSSTRACRSSTRSTT